MMLLCHFEAQSASFYALIIVIRRRQGCVLSIDDSSISLNTRKSATVVWTETIWLDNVWTKLLGSNDIISESKPCTLMTKVLVLETRSSLEHDAFIE